MRDKSTERLDAEVIASAMKNRIRISLFDSLDSTNSEARRQAEAGESTPALIIAGRQSAGRGRLGRSFYSPADTGLYMTFLDEAGEDISDSVGLTTAAAVAVAKAIEELCGKDALIKWVNDVYLDGKKVCGILCESFRTQDSKKHVAVGIGINLYTEEFPQELAGIAASVNPQQTSINAIASYIADRLCEYKSMGRRAELMEYYRSRSLVLGKRIVFTENGKTIGAFAESVDELGRLEVRLDDGRRVMLGSGEISLRLDDIKEN